MPLIQPKAPGEVSPSVDQPAVENGLKMAVDAANGDIKQNQAPNLLPAEIARLGLGKAIDATTPHPWESKSAYQAKEVKDESITFINEGSREINYSEIVRSYFELQGSIETSVKVPNKPIEVAVAADASRSLNQTRIARGKTIHTRTILFGIGGQQDTISKFDGDLTNWISVSYDSDHSHYQDLKELISVLNDKTSKKSREVSISAEGKEILAQLCYEFLLNLGGITHYVSSVTLGAMTYFLEVYSARSEAAAIRNTVKTPRIGGYTQKTSGVIKYSKSQSKGEKIGRMIQQGERDQVPPDGEAVIRYAFTPLTSLVSNPTLRDGLQEAVRNYMSEQLNTCSK